ncbi:hypothetical protein ASZ78_001408 [Callipepla squamata]|uniref:Torsin-1A C-terminal domain-containing protein n=1 Tax=Callipepla squamata TaxID=9009 RepID=A0A226MEA0_CALSU|nr:hypothetical protein ASZ78_001408 [Callipepla squamata]
MGPGAVLPRLGPACCLLLLLLGGCGGLGEEAPRFKARYEAVKEQLGAVAALSKRYWRQLACGVWQEGCEAEEEGKTGSKPGWSLPVVGQDYLEILSAWYCSFGKCCETGDCRIINNVTGLELDLHRQLHGQHLAKETIIRALRGFLRSPQPQKALVLSFHGWSGTGKNFVARMVAAHLYRDGLKSECVQLEKQISETVQLCRQSLFIFDEAEKLHVGLLDAVKPFVARSDRGQRGNRRSIFLFLSNIGGNAINEVALDFWRAGRAREEIPMELLEQQLRLEMLQLAENGYARSHLLEEDLVDFFVPFLPLEYHHVKLCVRDAFLARGLPYTEATHEEVARMMVFVPKEEKLFSAQGCKSVSQRINYFLP